MLTLLHTLVTILSLIVAFYIKGATHAKESCMRHWKIGKSVLLMIVQGILDAQSRVHRSQKKLGEGEASEIGEQTMPGPSEANQGRGKNLRVLSIRKLQ